MCPQEIIDELKSRAASQRRSLQQELRLILEETVKPDLLKAIRLAEEIRNKLTASGRTFRIPLHCSERIVINDQLCY